MRRWAWLVGTSVVLAACGIDVVGTDPAALDGGGTDARANSDAPAPGQDARPNEDGGGQPIGDAGTDANEGGSFLDVDVPKPELIEANINDVRSIAISPTSLYIARADTVIQWTGSGRQTVDAVKNARALAWGDGQLFYVTDDSIGRYRSDSDRDEHTGEVMGVDVLFAGNRPIGSFQKKVISYALGGPDNNDKIFTDIKELSDDTERPCGIASDDNNVFWTNRTQGYVGRSPMNAKGEQLITGLTAPNSIVVDGNDLYIAHGNSIVKAPKTGSAPYAPSNVETLYTSIGTPSSLAVNGNNLYWIDAPSGSLRRAPKSGGSTSLVTTLAQGGDNVDIALPRLIAFESNFVYWAQPIDKAVYRTQK